MKEFNVLHLFILVLDLEFLLQTYFVVAIGQLFCLLLSCYALLR